MPDPENKDLVRIITEHIRDRGGRIPFAEFMDLALYHPPHGYYHSGWERIGPWGDYYTSSNMHPIFGELIARQIHEMWEILGSPASFSIVEMGGGRGTLCADILKYCQEHLPKFFDALTYILVEKSRPFRKEQEHFLTGFTRTPKIEWQEPDDFLNGEEGITGCILSNELVDAFPVHVVLKEGRLKEIYVVPASGGFAESLGPLSTPFLEEYFDRFGKRLQEGQRAEVNLKALEWIEAVGRILEEGFVLTIDYGYEADELYHPSRRSGTILCYYRHTASCDPYARIGRQDITAHVNFTALIRRGGEVGLKKIGLVAQYKFLVALGLLEALEELEKKADQFPAVEFMKNKLAMRNFLIPGGMGSLFKVLAQRKGRQETSLRGFKNHALRPKP